MSVNSVSVSVSVVVVSTVTSVSSSVGSFVSSIAASASPMSAVKPGAVTLPDFKAVNIPTIK